MMMQYNFYVILAKLIPIKFFLNRQGLVNVVLLEPVAEGINVIVLLFMEEFLIEELFM
jgi:hypothetical protein